MNSSGFNARTAHQRASRSFAGSRANSGPEYARNWHPGPNPCSFRHGEKTLTRLYFTSDRLASLKFAFSVYFSMNRQPRSTSIHCGRKERLATISAFLNVGPSQVKRPTDRRTLSVAGNRAQALRIDV